MVKKYEENFTIGNMDLRIIDGKLQVRSHQGIAMLDSKFGISNNEQTVKLRYPFTTTSTTWIDVTGLLLHKPESEVEPNDQTKLIIDVIDNLKKEIIQHREDIRKILSLVTKLYEDGDINKDTFNKLDDFLKPYYDNPYQDGKY